MQLKMTPIVEVVNNAGSKSFQTAKSGDVGHDLYVRLEEHKLGLVDRIVGSFLNTYAMVIWPFTAKLVPSRIYVNQPDSTWCLVTGRSSAAKRKLMVLGGIIDSGYQGELFAVLHNFSLVPRVIKQNERYAQVVFFDAVRPHLRPMAFFSKKSERGNTGFGSSGR
jgi:deoxyuridine 5'-triphosphate nucleotidohydrolase